MNVSSTLPFVDLVASLLVSSSQFSVSTVLSPSQLSEGVSSKAVLPSEFVSEGNKHYATKFFYVKVGTFSG